MALRLLGSRSLLCAVDRWDLWHGRSKDEVSEAAGAGDQAHRSQKSTQPSLIVDKGSVTKPKWFKLNFELGDKIDRGGTSAIGTSCRSQTVADHSERERETNN